MEKSNNNKRTIPQGVGCWQLRRRMYCAKAKGGIWQVDLKSEIVKKFLASSSVHNVLFNLTFGRNALVFLSNPLFICVVAHLICVALMPT